MNSFAVIDFDIIHVSFYKIFRETKTKNNLSILPTINWWAETKIINLHNLPRSILQYFQEDLWNICIPLFFTSFLCLSNITNIFFYSVIEKVINCFLSCLLFSKDFLFMSQTDLIPLIFTVFNCKTNCLINNKSNNNKEKNY